ncbi:MAG: D-aminoacyl-tRNA deacylase [Candidatus Woesearchaeota archaeon]
MKAIIVSGIDPAGMNIRQRLIEHGFKETELEFDGQKVFEYKGTKLYTIQKRSIHCDNIDREIDADTIIFATTHRSSSGTHSLSVHVPGNYGNAELGGKDRQICTVPASLIRLLFLELQKQGEGLGYEITLETTHHGPFIEKPCVFIEIGSSEEQWKDEKAGMAIAKTLMETVGKEDIFPSVIVFGGGHYNQVANKILQRTKYSVGHICPKYALGELDEEMLDQMIERSVEKVELAVLDWKGLGEHKQKVKELLEKKGIKCERWDKISE